MNRPPAPGSPHSLAHALRRGLSPKPFNDDTVQWGIVAAVHGSTSTMLTTAASEGDAMIYTAAAPMVNDLLVVGSFPTGSPPPVTPHVTAVTGSGPYTVSITPGMPTTQSTGASVTALPDHRRVPERRAEPHACFISDVGNRSRLRDFCTSGRQRDPSVPRDRGTEVQPLRPQSRVETGSSRERDLPQPPHPTTPSVSCISTSPTVGFTSDCRCRAPVAMMGRCWPGGLIPPALSRAVTPFTLDATLLLGSRPPGPSISCCPRRHGNDSRTQRYGQVLG